MKYLMLILLMISNFLFLFIVNVQAIPGYDPDFKGHHLRITHVSWITHQEFPKSLISWLDNYNTSKFSYILMNFTTEIWNPNAVPVLIGSDDVYKKGAQLKVESNTIRVDVADLVGCFDSHYPKTDLNDQSCFTQPSKEYNLAPAGLSRINGSVVVRFNQSDVLGWPEGNYSIFFWTISSIPLYVVSNTSGVFQILGEVPDDWGSIKGLGYSATLYGILPFSSIVILYGPILLVIFFVIWKVKKKGARKNGK